jgi:hypothetical protein
LPELSGYTPRASTPNGSWLELLGWNCHGAVPARHLRLPPEHLA